MIAYLQGKIILKNKQSLVILNNQIGYEVFVSKSVLEEKEINQDLELFIYTKVREDEISLFGFPKREHLDFFKDLISVNGIGPKIALEILSNDINQTQNAILQENIAYLSKIPGIGKKTAERIIVELKNKVLPQELSPLNLNQDQQYEEVINALLTLGYQRGEIIKVLKQMPNTISSTEEMITYFLRNV